MAKKKEEGLKTSNPAAANAMKAAAKKSGMPDQEPAGEADSQQTSVNQAQRKSAATMSSRANQADSAAPAAQDGQAGKNPDQAAQASQKPQDKQQNQNTGSSGTQSGSTGVGEEQLKKAIQILNEYKTGKTTLDQRITDNEKWYRMRHWDSLSSKSSTSVKPTSGWLFNSIANKHADAMDNYPTCTIQPREEGDADEAKRLSSIIPVVLDQCGFEDVYDEEQDYKLKHGTGVFGVFWDPRKLNGLGDISIAQIDLLNLFWEPGVKDIQQGRNLFYVTMVDNDTLAEQYPDLGLTGSDKSVTISEYAYDDTVDTKDKSTVIDWYYKRLVNGVQVLHYCKFVGDKILFASENDPAYAQRGWYDHGLYPFVFDPLFRIAGTPCGFGYIDIGKSAQEYIDRSNQALLQNLLANARPRHFIRTDGAVNEKEYADMTKDFVHVDGNLGQDSIRPVEGKALPGNYITLVNNKIDELKEVTGNRDISTGGTMSGVTAASAIAAMQEAGSKLSRDSNKAAHRAFRKLCLMVIELIRQFYDLPRQFRITGEQGQDEFVSYDNSGITAQSQGEDMGVDMGIRVPLFDIAVSSEKASPYSRLSQNEMAMSFYNAGFFQPELATQALACMEMMDFDGKAKVVRMIQQNAQQFQQAQMMQQMAMMGGMGGMGIPGAEPGIQPMQGAAMPEQEQVGGESSITANARKRVANAADPG